MTKLKPCPFCGGETFTYDNPPKHIICCRGCNIQFTINGDSKNTIDAWNKREGK